MNWKDFLAEAQSLIQANRISCLWYLRKDYNPETPGQWDGLLKAIEDHGDLLSFQKARTLRTWLSQNSKKTSAHS